MIYKALEALPHQERDVERIFEVIRDVIERSPGSVEELFPGMALVPRQLSRKEISTKAAKASVERRQRQTDERYNEIVPHLRRWLEEDPEITLSKIRQKLTDMGLKPLRSDKWNRASILFMLKKAGLRNDDEQKET
jgi:hypothetical protein